MNFLFIFLPPRNKKYAARAASAMASLPRHHRPRVGGLLVGVVRRLLRLRRIGGGALLGPLADLAACARIPQPSAERDEAATDGL